MDRPSDLPHPTRRLSVDILAVTDAWKAAYPGVRAGVLAMPNVVTPAEHAALDERKLANAVGPGDRDGDFRTLSC